MIARTVFEPERSSPACRAVIRACCLSAGSELGSVSLIAQTGLFLRRSAGHVEFHVVREFLRAQRWRTASTLSKGGQTGPPNHSRDWPPAGSAADEESFGAEESGACRRRPT